MKLRDEDGIVHLGFMTVEPMLLCEMSVSNSPQERGPRIKIEAKDDDLALVTCIDCTHHPMTNLFVFLAEDGR